MCKYKRGTWSECNPVTNMKVMVKTLKRGDPVHCEATTTVERKCKKKKGPVTSKGELYVSHGYWIYCISLSLKKKTKNKWTTGCKMRLD